MKKLNNQAFTVAELMIAMAVFSTVLVTCAAAMITVGRQLRKAETSISTQNAARSIIEEVSRQAELSSDQPQISGTPNSGVICIGSIRYSYNLNTQVENTVDTSKNQGLHALWRDTLKNSGSCIQADLNKPDPSGTNGGDPDPKKRGEELVPEHARLARFSLLNGVYIPDSSGSLRTYPDKKLWDVDVAVLYGDNDLIDNIGTPDVGCISTTIGGSFCALSQLHTSVFRRVE